MEIEILKEKILSTPKDDKIYLLEVLSGFSGFFVYNGILLFLVKCKFEDEKKNAIKTNLLEMETYVNIQGFQNSRSFDAGYYNYLGYLGKFESNEFFSFIELCTLYSKNTNEISFTDFFHAMLELFQFPEEQQYKNALGLYGELKYLEFIYQKFSIDLTSFWHLSGPFSQYDISTSLFNIEIKTALSENIVKIKHGQIFNNHNNYLVSMICENYDSGETIKELIDKNKDLFSSLKFILKLKKELMKIKQNDTDQLKFYLNEVHIYKTDVINPFKNIPSDISELKYRYDLSEQNELGREDIENLFRSIK